MDRFETFMAGCIAGTLMSLMSHVFLDCSVTSEPAYYKEYYSDKKECERLLSRNQECYTVITWETREVENE